MTENFDLSLPVCSPLNSEQFEQDMLYVYEKAEIANDMVESLKGIPDFEEGRFLGNHRDYPADVWKDKIMPLIGCDVENYEWRLSIAAGMFKRFAEKYDLISPLSYTRWNGGNMILDLSELDPSMKSNVLSIITMLSNVEKWNREVVRIKCDGSECEGKSSTQFVDMSPLSGICFMNEPKGDAYCSDYSYNPFLDGMCWAIWCDTIDHRTNTRSIWLVTNKDKAGSIVYYKD